MLNLPQNMYLILAKANAHEYCSPKCTSRTPELNQLPVAICLIHIDRNETLWYICSLFIKVGQKMLLLQIKQ